MTTSCALCGDSIAGDLVFEDDVARVVLHEDWSILGHAMVISRTHVENASELSHEAWLRLSEVYRRTEAALLRATHADRAIMLKLGIAVPHLHLHIYPVRNTLDRAAVMQIIDGKVREPRDEGFVESVRKTLAL